MVPALGSFSGLYDKQVNPSGIFESKRVAYVQRGYDEDSGASFGYCTQLKAWTFRWPEAANSANTNAGVQLPVEPKQNIFDHTSINKGGTRRLQKGKDLGDRLSGTSTGGNQEEACFWKARSSETEAFDLTSTVEIPWYVQDQYGWEIVLDPVFISCYDCSDSEGDCSGRGTCSHAVCTCETGWAGILCQFPAPCEKLSMDLRFETFPGFRDWPRDFEPLRDESGLITAYDRPIFVGDSQDDYIPKLLFFTGRRWAATFLDSFSDATFVQSMEKDDIKGSVVRYFKNDFHGHWSNYTVEFLSAAMDIGKPGDEISPIGLDWFFAEQKDRLDVFEIQTPNLALPVSASILCSVCDNSTNPCRYDGTCSAIGSCQCAPSSFGKVSTTVQILVVTRHHLIQL